VTRTLERLGLESRFDAGLRVTDEAAMEAVEMTLSARVNQALVGELTRLGVPAVGLSGRDGGLLRAAPHARAGELGRVGRVAHVDAAALRALSAAGFVPVVSPVSGGRDGEAWNVNADHAAGALAAALGVDALLVATDVAGLRGADGETVGALTVADALELVRRGVAVDGMRPKVEACAEALGAGVGRAHLLPGARPGALEAAVLDGPGGGTVVRRSDDGARSRDGGMHGRDGGGPSRPAGGDDG
jgi:acetylglutamate kinase